MTIQEINKKNIWEIIRPITELQKNTQELYSQCKEDLDTLRKTILNTSSQIKFNEEEHRYFYKGEECMPVSNVVDLFVPETDFDLVAQNYVKKNNILEPWQRVRQKWLLKGTCSTTNGTFVHQYGEDLNWICNQTDRTIWTKEIGPKLAEWCYIDGYYIPVHPKSIAIYKYFEYCLANKEIPFLAEIKLVLDEHKISGTFDQLVYSLKDKGLVMRDYKTNSELQKAFKKPMKVPFIMYSDEPLTHYIIQQNLYSLMLRELGIRIKKKELVWLKENEQFELIQLPDIEDQVLKAVEGLY